MSYQKTRRLVRPGSMFCLCLFMAACGGGGGPATTDVQPAVVAAVTTTPVAALVTERLTQDVVLAPVSVVTPEVDGATPASVDETSCGLNGAQGIRGELLQAINAVRAAGAVCGSNVYRATHDLNWNNMLQKSAASHSRDMANNQIFSHVSSNGDTLLQRIQGTGYDLRAAGENIAAGQRSVKEVIASWLNSPGHCKNMLEPSYRDIGVACIRNEGAPYDFYWTMNLGRN